MNRGKRIASCPNFISKFTKRSEKDAPHSSLLEKIQRVYKHCNPRVFGQPVKLADLFVSVILRGGYRSVCDKRKWHEVAEELKLPCDCSNISVGLRRLYYQYLSGFEISEYPNLSENFFVQNSVELSSSESLSNELSSIMLSAVERNLGISCPDHATSYSNSIPLDLHSRSNYIHQYSHLRGQSEKSESSLDGTAMRATLPDSDLPDPMRFRDFTELMQLELSLSSGFHNDVDASLNSLLALSIAPFPQTRGMVSTVQLSRCNNLLNLVLASVGIFDHDEHSSELHHSIWFLQSRLNFSKFWNCAVLSPAGRVFLRPDAFVCSELHRDYEVATGSEDAPLFASPDHHSLTMMTMDCDDTGSSSLETSPEGSRVLLVATILVNLVTPPSGQAPLGADWGEDIDDRDLAVNAVHAPSLSPASSPLPPWKDNARVVASSPSALRFAFLCAHAHHTGVRQVGLQLLSSLQFPLEPLLLLSTEPRVDCLQALHLPVGCRLAEFSLDLLNHCLFESEDRANLLSGLQLLANLARLPRRGNETVLLTGLPAWLLWPRLAQLLCLPDLAVVCASMEALRCLTGMGPIACHCCWQACCRLDSPRCSSSADDVESPVVVVPTQLVRPLLALVTIEGQAMGSQSLHRIKLMRRPVSLPQVQVPPGHQPSHHQQQRYQPPPHTSQRSISLPLGVSCVGPDHPRWSHGGRPVPPPPLPPPALAPAPVHHPTPSATPHHYSFTTTTGGGLPTAAKHSSGTRTSVGQVRQQPSTSCTSLINLLASPSEGGANRAPDGECRQTSTSGAVASPAPSNSASGSVATVGMPTPPTVVKPSPSLSELTDRLQMPPPSLPPPSALRRSGKWSLVGRPASLGASSPASPTSPRAHHRSPPPLAVSKEMEEALTVGSAVVDGQGDTSLGFTAKHDSTCPSDVISVKASTGLVDSPAPMITSRSSADGGSPISRPVEACASNGPVTSPDEGTSVKVNGGWSSSPSSSEEEEEEEVEAEKELREGARDGDVPDKQMVNQEVKKVSPVGRQQQQAPNGLRPSILQAAIVALDNGRIDCSRSRLLNGTMGEKGEDYAAVERKAEMKHVPKEDPVEASVKPRAVDGSPQATSPLKPEESSRSSGDADSLLSNGCAPNAPSDQHSESASHLKTDESLPHRLVNGAATANSSSCRSPSADGEAGGGNSSSSGSSSGSSDSDASPRCPPPPASPAETSSRRHLLKRRRRGASRSRWIVQKRRRGDGVAKADQLQPCPDINGDVRPTTAGGSPLKALPLNTSESVPGSVLDPSWTPPHSLSGPACRYSESYSVQLEKEAVAGGESQQPTPIEVSSASRQDQSGGNAMHNVDVNRVSPLPKYLCEWESCCCSFDNKSQVSTHVYTGHLQQFTSSANRQQFYSAESEGRPIRRCCRWRGCQSAAIPRAPFALMTHVLDHHCSGNELEGRRRETTVGGLGAPQPPPSSSSDEDQSTAADSCSQGKSAPAISLNDSSRPGWGNQSAWSIVRQLGALQCQAEVWLAHHHYAAVNPFGRPPAGPTFLPPLPQNLSVAAPPREGPVTKHLRVTAALILRNLVTHLPEARRWLLSETPLLSDLVMGCTPNDSSLRTNDAGRIIAQCLAICTRSSSPAAAPTLSDLHSLVLGCQRNRQSFQVYPHHHQPQHAPLQEEYRHMGAKSRSPAPLVPGRPPAAWQLHTNRAFCVPLPPVDMDS